MEGPIHCRAVLFHGHLSTDLASRSKALTLYVQTSVNTLQLCGLGDGLIGFRLRHYATFTQHRQRLLLFHTVLRICDGNRTHTDRVEAIALPLSNTKVNLLETSVACVQVSFQTPNAHRLDVVSPARVTFRLSFATNASMRHRISTPTTRTGPQPLPAKALTVLLLVESCSSRSLHVPGIASRYTRQLA